MKHRAVKWTVMILIAIMADWSLLSCTDSRTGKSDRGKKVVTVSIAPQEWLLRQIVDDDLIINTLLPDGADPETYEPSMQAMRWLEQSREYAMVGTLPFEHMQQQKLSHLYPHLRLSRSDAGMHLLYGTHRHDSHHEHHNHHGHHHDTLEADPHVWVSPANLRVMADSLLAVAVRVNPVKAPTYRQRHSALLSRIDSLQQYMAAKLAAMRGCDIVIWHPSLSYLAHDYGLHQVAVQQGHKEPAPRQVATIIDNVKRHGAALLILESQHSPHMTEAINADMQLPVVTVNLLAPDIITTLRNLTDRISENDKR